MFKDNEQQPEGFSVPLNEALDNLAFNDAGLVPVIAQQHDTGEVLMFAWMNRAYAPCVVLIAAQGAFYFNLLHSDNLWDYLIDPWLVFWATGWLVRDRLVVRRDVRAARRQATTRAGEAPRPASEPAGSRS